MKRLVNLSVLQGIASNLLLANNLEKQQAS
jgi:hypothetical protein